MKNTQLRGDNQQAAAPVRVAAIPCATMPTRQPAPLTVPRLDLPRGALRVAAAQAMTVPGAVADNLARMEPLVAQAALRGAHLVLFSESQVTAYDHKGVGIAAAIALDGPAIAQLHEMARRHGLIIVTGFFEKDGDRLYNSCAAIAPDGRRVVQRKHAVTAIEQRFGVQAGPAQRTLFEVNGVRFAMVICADGGIDNLRPTLVAEGCDVMLAPTAGLGDAAHGYHLAELSDPARRAAYLKDAASVCFSPDAPELGLTLGLGLLACNQMGYDQTSGFFHCGHSMMVDTDGCLVGLIPGQFAFEHLRPSVIVGVVHARGTPAHARRLT